MTEQSSSFRSLSSSIPAEFWPWRDASLREPLGTVVFNGHVRTTVRERELGPADARQPHTTDRLSTSQYRVESFPPRLELRQSSLPDSPTTISDLFDDGDLTGQEGGTRVRFAEYTSTYTYEPENIRHQQDDDLLAVALQPLLQEPLVARHSSRRAAAGHAFENVNDENRPSHIPQARRMRHRSNLDVNAPVTRHHLNHVSVVRPGRIPMRSAVLHAGVEVPAIFAGSTSRHSEEEEYQPRWRAPSPFPVAARRRSRIPTALHDRPSDSVATAC